LTCILPLSEIVTDFFDLLKSRSSGFASFDYEDAGYRQSDLAKMTFLLNGKPVDALALIVHRSAQETVGKQWVKKLHKVIPRQLFEVPIQAAVGKKIIARETLKAMRADVTAGLYGGHYERKMKHLENQKEGKRRMKKMGTVDLPQEAFFDILSNKK
jgi:translation elongation factor EF-4